MEGTAQVATNGTVSQGQLQRSNSISQVSESSQTAQQFINSQLQLEAEAREALPYQFDTCTRALGSIRQKLFSCLTCNPPSTSQLDPYTPAGVCYSCSISCHGEHTLVELFDKRNFTCDCGTTRIKSKAPCEVRFNEATATKGGVSGEEPAGSNAYNQNFRNRFCGCSDTYDPHTEKGTMFQCLGLGTAEDGGCGEDWWHPECVIGISRDWMDDPAYRIDLKQENGIEAENQNGITSDGLNTIGEESAPDGTDGNDEAVEEEDPPLPPGFPDEDSFEHFICYKCNEAFPWLKQYSSVFRAVPHDPAVWAPVKKEEEPPGDSSDQAPSLKRKASDDDEISSANVGTIPERSIAIKRQKSEDPTALMDTKPVPSLADTSQPPSSAESAPKHASLAAAPTGKISLFLPADFRDHLCRCPYCFPHLTPHPQLLDEEETYEPPFSEASSENGAAANGGGSTGSRSLLDRGEAALSNVDRVRAIEGVMAYNHLKEKVKSFLKPFADSGQPVGAEDIKAYFEKLRGDDKAIKEAAGNAEGSNGDTIGDGRREQGGY